MNIQGHMHKARRIESSMAKLDVDLDYETIIENCMLAGTHYLNAILHAVGVTAESEDLLHSDKPELTKPVDIRTRSVLAAMKCIEDLRPGLIRGDDAYRHEIGLECLAQFAKVKGYCNSLIPQGALKGEGR